MIAGTKPTEYYRDQNGVHPVFGLSSIADAAAILAILGTDWVKDTHVDWGTGAGQVSAADVPIADAGEGYTGTTVEAALQELLAHAARHQSGGADSIKLDDLAAAEDNTDLDASTEKHGLLPKLGGGTTNFLRADGSWAAPVAGGTTPPDIDISTDRTQRVIWANNLHITASCTLTCDAIVCEGNLTIDDSVTVTFNNCAKTPEGGNSVWFLKQASTTLATNVGGAGAWGGTAGTGSSDGPAGGGGSLGAAGGQGATSGAGGVAFQSGLAIGGAGGNGYSSAPAYDAGGGGAGPGAAGGAGATANGGAGGASVLIYVKGNLTIGTSAVLNANGGVGQALSDDAGGGGGGGCIGIVCLGTYTNSGSITCAGGDGGNNTADGGGGGGGHVEIFANTSTFGTISVAGGVGPGSATDGATGTQQLVDISSDDSLLLWSEVGDASAGYMIGLLIATLGLAKL